jgi:hypothetical protein
MIINYVAVQNKSVLSRIKKYCELISENYFVKLCKIKSVYDLQRNFSDSVFVFISFEERIVYERISPERFASMTRKE